MRILTIAPPEAEPLTPDAAETWLGYEPGTIPDLAAALSIAAREHVEQMTGRALARQTLELVLDRFPRGPVLPLPRPPLVSVESVKYYDTAGTLQTMDAADYVVDTGGLPGAIYAESGWPSTSARPGAVVVQYVCGPDTEADPPESCPEPLVQCMRFLVAHWYDAKAPVVIGTVAAKLAFTLEALASPFKVFYRLPD